MIATTISFINAFLLRYSSHAMVIQLDRLTLTVRVWCFQRLVSGEEIAGAPDEELPESGQGRQAS